MHKKPLFILSILLTFNYLSAQTEVEIWEIQGTGIFSPYLNQVVKTNKNIVTAVGDDFFFMQTPSYRSDNQLSTSDGIRVNTNNTPTVEVGDMITITGTVRESFQRTQFDQDDPLSIVEDSVGIALPDPIILTENFPSGNVTDIPDLEKVEGMLVSFPQATTTGPTNQFGETTIKIGPKRSFREPGIIIPAPNGLPEWDGNPEVFEIRPDKLGLQAQPFLSGGINVSATGVMDYAFEDYLLYPTSYEITGESPLRSVDDPELAQATIGCVNFFVLSDQESEYLIRRQKVASYIVDLMKAPDIVAVQEVRSLAVLQDIANLIKEENDDINYTPYLLSNGTSGSFVINVGYLVKNTLSDIQITQLGANEQTSFGGTLHFRPPLLLEANFNTTPPQPIQVLNLHMKSLNGITGGSATTTRTRRHEQAISVALMVEERVNENLVVLGDFNAFQFSDGYVDIVNQIAGTPSIGAEYPVQDIVSVPLTNQSLSVPEEEQYSYVFQGNAQILDHCLTTDFQGFTVDKLQYVRANADNSNAFVDQLFPNYRTSDHDGFVLFLDLENELSTNVSQVLENNFSVKYLNPFSGDLNLELELEEQDELYFSLVDLDGKIIYEKNLGISSEGKHFKTIPLQIPDGIYFLNLKGKKSYFTGKIISINR